MTKAEKRARKAMLEVVGDLLRENPEARTTYTALREQGHSDIRACEELARALVGCVYEAWHGMPDRWADVLRALREGRSTEELFPDALYEGNPPGSPYRS
jgi:LmbE family N-acetylglucosaminyl deacetylase